MLDDARLLSNPAADSRNSEHLPARDSFLAHHFDTPAQQFDAGKLGVWLFLMTEVLFFAGPFCAYAIYRVNRPEVFDWSHYFLSTKLGALNTCVLLVSSLTAACAVRFAQRGERRLLLGAIFATLVCSLGFLGIKAVEYSAKFEEGLLPGAHFNPREHVWELPSFARAHPAAARYAELLTARARDFTPNTVREPLPPPTREALEPLLHAGVLGRTAEFATLPSRPQNAHVFFGIYFFMTGLHGLHVLGGAAVWAWLFVRASRGVFGPRYFGPVDFAALYWHFVDLIWIYLFPLLYLIH
ncbi:MAG TPA: cytochrome c oxidase subunit 3 [Polyangiaceae bacterium]